MKWQFFEKGNGGETAIREALVIQCGFQKIGGRKQIVTFAVCLIYEQEIFRTAGSQAIDRRGKIRKSQLSQEQERFCVHYPLATEAVATTDFAAESQFVTGSPNLSASASRSAIYF